MDTRIAPTFGTDSTLPLAKRVRQLKSRFLWQQPQVDEKNIVMVTETIDRNCRHRRDGSAEPGSRRDFLVLGMRRGLQRADGVE